MKMKTCFVCKAQKTEVEVLEKLVNLSEDDFDKLCDEYSLVHIDGPDEMFFIDNMSEEAKKHFGPEHQKTLEEINYGQVVICPHCIESALK